MPPRPRHRAAGAPGGHPPGEVGRRGEELACQHLRRLGFELLERNVRGAMGEIDVIARDGGVLVFVEVKTVGMGSRAGGPSSALERLTPRQRARLRRCALAWLAGRPRGGWAELRFDAIGVLLGPDGRLLALDHLRGAW